MKFQRSGFYKGIPNYHLSSSLYSKDIEEREFNAVENSIYKRWWDLMRLSPVYWYARERGIAPVIPEIAATYEIAGDLSLESFRAWWKRHGQYVFEEAERPAAVRQLNVDGDGINELYDHSLVVEIPLTVTSKKILRDIKKILRDVGHDVTGHNVINQSNASLKLKSKKFNITTLEHEYWVLIYRILYPEISIWKIGDRLQLAPNNRVRSTDPRAPSEVFHRGRGPIANLQSVTGRNLYKARFARYHVERGSFPNYARVADLDTVQPFGPVHHQEFLEATNETNRDARGRKIPDSEWQKEVRERYAKDLLFRVLQVNRHDRRYIQERGFKEQYGEFIAGSIDLA